MEDIIKNVLENVFNNKPVTKVSATIWVLPNKMIERNQVLDVQSALKRFCMNQKPVSLKSKTGLETAFKNFVKTLPFGSPEYTRRVLSQYGISNASSFRDFIYDSFEELIKGNFNVSWVKDWELTAPERDYINAKEAGDFREIDIDSCNDQDLIVYSRYDPDYFKIYRLNKKNSKSENTHIINACKCDFKFTTGTEYFECYPITVGNYKKNIDNIKYRAYLDLNGHEDF